MTAGWCAWLQPETRARARDCLECIVAGIPPTGPFPGGGCLAGGAAGLALFHAYLHRFDPSRDFRDRAKAFLDMGLTSLAEEPMAPGLLGGVAGIAWAHSQVLDALGEAETEDSYEVIDRTMVDYLTRGPSGIGFDLVEGLVGIGIYGIQRARQGRREILAAAVAALARQSIAVPPGRTWFTPPGAMPTHQRLEAPRGYFNLGLAHGIPAVPALLGQALALGIGGEPERRLYREAVAWLLAQRNPEGDAAAFGSWVAKDETDDQRQVRRQERLRVAWCYGDISVGVALLGGARAMNDHETETAALELCRKSARCPVAEAGMTDACLCHGAAGNAHLFHRLYHCTCEPAFAAAAEAYLLQTMACQDSAQEGTGFRFWLPRHEDDPDPWRPDAGLLNGTTGVGLALLGFLDKREPLWDGCLLTDLPGWR